MKRFFLFTTFLLLAVFGGQATVFLDLWITGSAVPGTTQKIDPSGDQPGRFTYNGRLLSGEFKLMTTATAGSDTQYFVPLISFESIGNISDFQQTGDDELPGWTVCDAGTYSIPIDFDTKTLTATFDTSSGQLDMVDGNTDDYQCIVKDGHIEIITLGNEGVETVVLFDINGKIQAVSQNQTGRLVLGNHLSAGSYLVQIKDSTKTTVKKVIVN